MRITAIILIFSFAIFQLCCNGIENEKFFSGIIEYDYSYASDSLKADSLAKERPAKGIFRYDQGNYQSSFIGKDSFTYYYSGSLNKCVAKTGLQPSYQCEDYNIVTDSVLSVKFYDTDERIAGYACSILEMQKSHSWVRYYVSRELKIAPATYQRHRSYNWDVYGKKADGGLILKSEHRFKNFTMYGIVSSLKRYDSNFIALEIDEKKIAEICQ